MKALSKEKKDSGIKNKLNEANSSSASDSDSEEANVLKVKNILIYLYRKFQKKKN